MPTITVKSSAGSYSVVCSRGALARAALLISRLGDSTGTFLVSSPRVWRHCGGPVGVAIPASNARRPILFDDSESKKRLATVEGIARQLLRAGADRKATLVAVGGGVVGDVAGFAAATYLRGVRLVHIPTTLVAQVDSAVGGKTAVDLPEGKNLVGAFYPPELVVVDPALLGTLPHRTFRSGLYEVIKYGVIADRRLFEFLEKRMDSILRRDPAALDFIVARSIKIKAGVVGRDEREVGLRQILNFGHTLGHAFETATNYRRFLHGEAIGWGMLAVTSMALEMKKLSRADAIRIAMLIASVGPLPRLGNIAPSRVRVILQGDKKTRGGRVRWVLPRRIGSAEWGQGVAWPLVARTMDRLPRLAAEMSPQAG